MDNYINQIQKYINDEIEVLKRLDLSTINEALNLLIATNESGNTVYIFGNGYSS